MLALALGCWVVGKSWTSVQYPCGIGLKKKLNREILPNEEELYMKLVWIGMIIERSSDEIHT